MASYQSTNKIFKTKIRINKWEKSTTVQKITNKESLDDVCETDYEAYLISIELIDKRITCFTNHSAMSKAIKILPF